MSVSVQEEDFCLTDEIAQLRDGRTDIGAIVTFTGTVRDMAGGVPITSMILEHYPGMTEKQLEDIEHQAHERWPLIASRIIHRYGTLQPGDQIVLVITLSAHRRAAFEAAEFLMDFLKTKAPFWKREEDEAGTGTWVDAKETDDQLTKRWEK